MNDLAEFIQTTKDVLNRINSQTDTIFTSFKSPEELKESIHRDLAEIENGNLDKLKNVYQHFLPTSTFQEISINDNWGDEYVELAGRMDELYMRLKPREVEASSIFKRFLNWIRK